MDSSQLRKAWLDFFGARGHTVVPSAGLIPHHPTAPMFTNSGMMQFVPYFLGEEKVPYDPPRAVSVQKCVRVGGKHNDLDAIGRSPRHMSFFEMLGNFSFGDYFKVDAIRWAWELVTETLGLEADRIWVTVHVDDDEAAAIWSDEVGFPADRIQRFDKDNFWEMGETGPCGPCSELFWDFGPDVGPGGGPAEPAAENRYVEIWNLVFTQFFRQPDGTLTDLPSRNVDTGGGLERMLCAINDTPSVYDTDVLAALVETAASVTGHVLGRDAQADVAVRLLADHARTMTFLVADGVIPSNEDRGYVLRRVIRRAVRFAYLLGVHRPVLPPLVGCVVERMGDAYPELGAGEAWITDMIAREEEGFRQTLARGVVLLDETLATTPAQVPGEVAFKLHDTFGFPFEVTQEIAAERGVGVDLEGFETLMADQRRRAKLAGKRTDAYENLETYQDVVDRFGPTEFVGREEPETKAAVVAVVGDSVFLDRSPFYAESGGQVGDTGTISTDSGSVKVLDTVYALPGLHRHVVEPVSGTVEAGQEATATIDVERRDAIRRNHTGTHILHWALRRVLGEHVKQQGSLVAPDRLRFDFGPADGLTPDQIAEIEDLANREILANPPVRHFETTKQQAEQLGAIAFFGEKYGDVVRVLEAGPNSTELCGGTHVKALGDIGPLKIVKEESIGANLRRVEAVTGLGPIDRLRQTEGALAAAADSLNVPVGEVVEGARKRLDELKALRDELKALRRQAASGRAAELAGTADDGVVIARVDGLSRDDLKDLAVAVRDQPGVRAVVLGGEVDGGGAALVAAAAADGGLDAGALLDGAGPAIKGGGRADPLLTVLGGKDPTGVDGALASARAAAGAGG